MTHDMFTFYTARQFTLLWFSLICLFSVFQIWKREKKGRRHVEMSIYIIYEIYLDIPIEHTEVLGIDQQELMYTSGGCGDGDVMVIMCELYIW